MSWDVLLVPLPAELVSVGDLPDGFAAPALGRKGEVQAVLREHLREIDMSDPRWGMLTGPNWSIELSIGHSDPIESIMLYVRGSGDDVLPVIHRLAAAVGCRAFDCSAGDLLAPDDGSSWHAFQAFRDQFVPRTAPVQPAWQSE